MRVILHAGFHKTGTSSVQATLRANRRRLKPHLRVILRPAMVAACDSARAYSISGDPLDLALFQYELAQLAEGWDVRDTRPVLISAEDLCGHMPGRHGLAGYDAAPQLMLTAAQTLAEIRPEARVEFIFTTRAAEPWLASCHAQHLRAMRMRLDRAEFARAWRGAADLPALVATIAQVLAPRAVHQAALEDCAHRRLGPLDPILDILALPDRLRAALVPQPPANRAPSPARQAELLRLNRSDLSDGELKRAKAALPPEPG